MIPPIISGPLTLSGAQINILSRFLNLLGVVKKNLLLAFDTLARLQSLDFLLHVELPLLCCLLPLSLNLPPARFVLPHDVVHGDWLNYILLH